MKKRLIALLMVVSIVFSISACGDSAPDTLTKETYKLGKEALSVMDKYLAEKIDAEDLEKKLSVVMTQLEAESDTLSKKTAEGDIEATMYSFYNHTVAFWVSGFVMGMYGYENAEGNTYDCQSVRDGLAEVLEVN